MSKKAAAREVIAKYDLIVNGIERATDGDESDFVMRALDYEALCEYIVLLERLLRDATA